MLYLRIKDEYEPKFKSLKQVYNLKKNNELVYKLVDLELQRFNIKT